MSETIKWLLHTKPITNDEILRRYHVRQHCICNDGFTISIQASEGHYCHPRKYLDDCKYKTVELGYPSEVEILLNGYHETEFNCTDTVFVSVPTSLVDEILHKHGGVCFDKV